MIGISAAVMMISAVVLAATESDVVSVWTVPDGQSRVEIYKAADGTYEGKIIWISEPLFSGNDPEAGKPKHDRENPDPALKDRPIIGLVIMKGLKFDGSAEWSGGTVYDPNCGKTYKGKIWLTDNNTLSMRGYIGISLLGRTESWTRYTEPKK
jgi:uncharacterized protein (DUF2147 family)